METINIIFPLVLNDEAQAKIIQIIKLLLSIDLKTNYKTFPNHHDCVLNLAKAIIELEDIVKNPNTLGYCYTCYVLVNSILLLSFISSIIKNHSLTYLADQLISMEISITGLNEILYKSLISRKI